jgi:CubicO group peptidase (beta-lactamase class C family)
MYKFLFILALLINNIKAQPLYFPPISGDTWETIDPSSLGWCHENIEVLYDYLELTNSKAFLLLKDGKIVLEKYFGTFTKDSLHLWNSADKTLTALAVGIAQQEGHLSINDKTSDYLGQGWTSLTPQQEELITIKHQLKMTSGLTHIGDPNCTLPECLVYVSAPDSRWSYHNAPYTLLDKVILNATGTNLNLYVNQKIRTKIGMNGFFFPIGYYNINLSNARSMARFGLLLLNNGNWNGTEVINDQNYLNEMLNSSQNLNPSYGYLTWLNGKSSYMLPSPDVQFSITEPTLPNAPSDIYAAMGKDGQILNVSPSNKLILVRMGKNDGNSLVGNQYNDTIWQKINNLPCQNNLYESNDKNTTFFPNPVQNYIFSSIFIENDEIELTDIYGKVILKQAFHEKIDVKDLPKGIYYLSLNKNAKFKFLKE